jgi:uncharacterized protein YecT (DUF1311 family)
VPKATQISAVFARKASARGASARTHSVMTTGSHGRQQPELPSRRPARTASEQVLRLPPVNRAPALVAGLAVFAGGFASACDSGGSSSPASSVARRTTQAARLEAPVIRESINPLPCPRGRAARQTTLGARACLNKAILRTDAAINARAKAIFRMLRDRTGKVRFLAAERAWLAYRTASCTSVADVYRGGSAQPVAFADCVVRRNRAHLNDLVSVHDFLRRIH